MAARPALAASIALLAVACGASPAAAPPRPPVETVIGKAPERDAVPHRTLAELKVEFLSICTLKVPELPDYCECSWEQMTTVFSAEEMTSPVADLVKQRLLKDRIEANCASKPPAK